MTASQIVGVAILVLVFGGIFALTVQMGGWAEAALCWVLALAGASLIFLGCFLVFGS